jgi:hypothetical protein
LLFDAAGVNGGYDDWENLFVDDCASPLEFWFEGSQPRVSEEYFFVSNVGYKEAHLCYGRLAVVSDMDDGGFALNVDKELRGSAVL